MLKADDSGTITVSSPVMDYMHRGAAMENWNVLRFYLDSYEHSGSATGPSRVPYQSSHPHQKKVFV